MAFEDRSSPNTATSPSSDRSQNTINSPNSPESSRTSSYTCRTIPTLDSQTYYHQKDAASNAFFRITAFALSNQSNTPARSPYSQSDSSSDSSSPQPEEVLVDDNDIPRIQTLKYSIRNILQPDFGKNAVQKTRVSPKIGFRPYEELLRNKNSSKNESSTLGSLSLTVAQIGQCRKQEEPSRLVLDESRVSSPVAKDILPSPDAVKTEDGADNGMAKLWPAWVYCTRYSDRPSSGPRSKRAKKDPSAPKSTDDKRPRTAFSGAQLARLKHEFAENRYLTERRRQQLSAELGLNEAQIKIWFQNKRAKIKKASGQKNPLALQLMAQGLYNHTTMTDEEGDMPMPMPGPGSGMIMGDSSAQM